MVRPRDQYQCDLIDFQKYRQFNTARYMLNCVDVYSRYAMSIPIKTKGDAHVYPAMEEVFASIERERSRSAAQSTLRATASRGAAPSAEDHHILSI